VDAMHERLAAVAAAEGLPLDFSAVRVRPSTRAAHRLLTAAVDVGREAQQALADGLFGAYWASGKDIGDPAVLKEVAVSAGLTPGVVAAVLGGGAYAERVREEERQAQAAGIHAVPTFIVDGRFALSGAQPSAVLARAVRQALETRGA